MWAFKEGTWIDAVAQLMIAARFFQLQHIFLRFLFGNLRWKYTILLQLRRAIFIFYAWCWLSCQYFTFTYVTKVVAVSNWLVIWVDAIASRLQYVLLVFRAWLFEIAHRHLVDVERALNLTIPALWLEWRQVLQRHWWIFLQYPFRWH